MEDDILIDNYLNGLLSKDEEESFLERLESDSDFYKLFELEKQLADTLNEGNWSFVNRENPQVKEYVKSLEDSDLQNLKKTLVHTNSEFNNKQNKRPRKLFYYLAAASVVVFLGFQFFFNQNTSNQELYNDYVALDDLPSFASRGNTSDELIMAQSLFEAKKYEEVLPILKSQLSKSEHNANIFIYQGLAQVELEKYNEAEKTFSELANSDLLDAEKGYWYKALLFLKTDRVEEAKKLLDAIIAQSLYNFKKAKELLSDL